MTRILAIDDEKDILMLIKNALAKEGYDVTLLSDPLKIGEVNLNAYQLILLDVMMPGHPGPGRLPHPVFDGQGSGGGYYGRPWHRRG